MIPDKSAQPFQESEAYEMENQHVVIVLEPPWITYGVILICAAICIYLNLFQQSPHYEEAAGFLFPRAFDIWSGAYWGLITSAFVHIAFWHILFNLWWTKDFGLLLEPTMGRARYLVFIISAAIASSSTQLAISDQTGIGFSGVVYAMFGYGLAARHAQPIYQFLVNKQVIYILLGWLVLCIVLSVFDIWKIANGAHMAGFLFGYCTGNVFTAQKYIIPCGIGLFLLTGLMVLSLAYMPWSKAWNQREMFAKYENLVESAKAGDPEAQYLFGMILRQGEKYRESQVWLRKSAEQGYVPAMNDLAWMLSTHPDEALRQGREAVTWAGRACKESNWKEPNYIDTLAAAYAETDDWEKAVSTQRKAIETLSPGDSDIRSSFESRLQRYLNQEKFRE